MTKYIEREEAIANSREYNLGGSYYNTERAVPVDVINAIPAADVRPVVRGTWIRPTRVPDSMLSECSVCGFDTGAYTFNFCPNCGADMREESNND